MAEILHKLGEAFKATSFPIILFLAFHASQQIRADRRVDDPAPGDNFPGISF